MLLQHYPIITDAFLQLPTQHQIGISRIMQLSGEGYALFLDREIQTMAEYNAFCRYALGVVAIEWSRVSPSLRQYISLQAYGACHNACRLTY